MRPPLKCIQNYLIQDIFRKHWFPFGQNKKAQKDDANNGGFDKEWG